MTNTKFHEEELKYWQSRAIAAEQRLRKIQEGASTKIEIPPEPPVGTTYAGRSGKVQWKRKQDGWHCAGPRCYDCPTAWEDVWEYGIGDLPGEVPVYTRQLGRPR